MKNLVQIGQFNRNVGLKYQSILEEAGINATVEDWGNSLEVTAGYSLVRLLVPIQDYQRSLKLLDDFEDNASKRLKENNSSVDRELFKTVSGIIVAALIAIGIIYGISNAFKFYNLQTAKNLFKEAKAESKRGNFAQAINEYSKVINIYPYNSAAIFNRGLAYRKLKNYTYALADFYKVIEINPDDEMAYGSIGLTFYDLGNFNKAIDYYTKAIEMNPRDSKAYLNRGLVYDKEKNYPQAISDFTQATILDSNNAIAYNNLGYTYAEQGNLSQAFIYLNKAIEMDPKSKYAYTSRAFAFYQKKVYEKAWEDVHKEESFGYKQEKEDLDFLAKLKKASGRDK